MKNNDFSIIIKDNLFLKIHTFLLYLFNELYNLTNNNSINDLNKFNTAVIDLANEKLKYYDLDKAFSLNFSHNNAFMITYNSSNNELLKDNFPEYSLLIKYNFLNIDFENVQKDYNEIFNYYNNYSNILCYYFVFTEEMIDRIFLFVSNLGYYYRLKLFSVNNKFNYIFNFLTLIIYQMKLNIYHIYYFNNDSISRYEYLYKNNISNHTMN